MKPGRLIGYWSEAELTPSSPELTELGFRPDGSGWLYWSSWSTAFVVYRFTWRLPTPGHLATRLTLALDGAWSHHDGHTSHRVERWAPVDREITVALTLDDDVLNLANPLDDALGGTSFKPVPTGGTDPTLARSPID